jgi:hypothetical protein
MSNVLIAEMGRENSACEKAPQQRDVNLKIVHPVMSIDTYKKAC